jgi:DNA-binding transcriptional regulator GbsR (MarR family)
MDSDESDNAADSKPPLTEYNAALSRFIENMGLHYEEYGVPRIGGRIMGLLMFALRPLSADDIADALQVSRSSISTNLRTLIMADLVEKISLPGERVDYYLFSPDAWQRALEMRLAGSFALREMAEETLEELQADHPARARLEELSQWAELLEKMVRSFHNKWQSRQEAPLS